MNFKRMKKNLEYIGTEYNSEEVGYNRLAFSKEEKEAINWLERELTAYEIKVRRDTIGNLFTRVGPENGKVYAF